MPPSFARRLARAIVAALASTLVLTLGAAVPAPAAGARDPLFGGTVFPDGNESYDEAYDRVMRTYGRHEAIRMFFPGMPSSWSNIKDRVGRTPVVASFRADPRSILSGDRDQFFRQWFRSAPKNRPTYWSYWHEPENDSVDKGDYRRAWRHLSRLSRDAGNPRLKPTLILMCWTLDKNSGRSWRDWYAGDRAIHTLAFDCYNVGRKNGVYKAPRDILRPVVRVARRTDNRWGIAEFGSTVVETDGGQAGRARWLRRYGSFVRNHGGEFATYFDSYVGYDYRLHDRRSAKAWRRVVNG